MGEEERDAFELFLNRKGLSGETKKKYLLSYDKITEILVGACQSIDQSVVNAFLDLYPHIIARATMKNYLEFIGNKDLAITKRTGSAIKKEHLTISSQERESLRMALYEQADRYGLIFDLTDACALRRQEVLNIKAGDLDISDGEKMFILIRMGKGNKQRKVFVREDVAILVVKYLESHPMKLDDYLFESTINKGFPMNKTTWSVAFSKVKWGAKHDYEYVENYKILQ
jgi:integrase